MARHESIGQTWRSMQKRLEAAGIQPAPREGRQLVGHALGLRDEELVRQEGDPFPPSRLEELQRLAGRRLAGEPLGYVVGHVPFWERDWAVTPAVLIPRPDSEILLREVLARVRDGMRVVEIGVGSGCLVGSLLAARPGVQAVGTDASAAALAVARGNLREAGVLDRCDLRAGDLLAGAEGPFDVVFSNPPYVADDEYRLLEAGVRDFEPELALRAGPEGMDIYRRLVPAARHHLRAGGWLCLEIGWMQGALVQDVLTRSGFSEVEALCDLAGRDRVVVGRKG